MERTPKVFISYSWSSKEHQERVRELAERLMDDGIDVVLDVWDLQAGQDIYAFMEQSVVLPEIDRVLLILDKEYAEKADERRGGVGDETTIISPEIYRNAKQEKFIPIIFECDDNGNPFRPAYLKSTKYYDLSDESTFEDHYEQLVRNIYERPLFRKPSLGKAPEFIFEERSSYASLRGLVRNVKDARDIRKGRIDILIRRFIDDFSSKMDENRIGELPGEKAELVMKKIDEMKDLRDIYLDFLEALLMQDVVVSEFTVTFFQSAYNNVYSETKDTRLQIEYDHFLFLIWEMLVCTVAYLLHYERYEIIRDIVNHTYFLRSHPRSEEKAKTFTDFRPHLQSLENVLNKRDEQGRRLYSLTAETAIHRERLPIISKNSIVEADVLLCQLSWLWIAESSRSSDKWFPMTYVYNNKAGKMWAKLVSIKYCEKTMVMYGASNISDLRELARKGQYTREIGYSGSFESAPCIASIIEIEKIGSMP